MLVRDDSNIILRAWIDFEIVGKLSAESRDFDSLAGAQAANVDTRRGADERMNFAGTIIDEDDESEWQIINDGLSDRPSDRDKLAFGVFTYVAGCDRQAAALLGHSHEP